MSALCVQGKLPVVFVPLPLAPCGTVRVVFICYLIQMSASVFGPSNSLLTFAVCILLLVSVEDRAIHELKSFPQALLRLVFALRISFPIASTVARSPYKKRGTGWIRCRTSLWSIVSCTLEVSNNSHECSGPCLLLTILNSKNTQLEVHHVLQIVNDLFFFDT